MVTTLNAKYIHTNLALRYLKSYAQDSFDITIKEFTIKDPAMHIVSELYALKPDVIGFSCYIWNIEESIPLFSMLKKVLPETKIVLGGPEVSYDVTYWLDRLEYVDYIVVGEGEDTFKHFLQELSTDQKYHLVFGLAYRDKNGQAVVNPPRPKLDLSQVPSPFRFEEDLPHLSKRIAYIETSRGCPFSCQFCLSSIEVGVRYFDIARMKEEILFLIANGAKLIKFVDRTFNIKRDYALDMFQFLIENHQGCVFQFEITADIMRPEVLDYLNEHAPEGIFRFEIGVQSTNDLTNELVHRKQNFEKLSRTVNMVRDGGKITQHLDLIAGLPEEDYHSFRKTFNDVFALQPEELQLGFLKMLRGTGLRARAAEHQYVYMDHAPYEILSNNILSFDEIIRIKAVEDVLEKYWNSHKLDQTIHYVTRYAFETPFDFFQAYGDFWEDQNWAKIGHQLEDLFIRLLTFLEKKELMNPLLFSLMKYDFLTYHQYKPRKLWWEDRYDKLEKRDLLNTLDAASKQAVAAALGLEVEQIDRPDISKHLIIEPIALDLEHFLRTKEAIDAVGYLFVYYNPKTHRSHATTLLQSHILQ